jgi:hypothetical protein
MFLLVSLVVFRLDIFVFSTGVDGRDLDDFFNGGSFMDEYCDVGRIFCF